MGKDKWNEKVRNPRVVIKQIKTKTDKVME